MKRLLTSVAPVALAALLAACASPSSQFSYTVPAQPEGSSGYSAKPGWATSKFAVAAANPLATDAGYQVLKAGGSAIDAAIAVQTVLTVPTLQTLFASVRGGRAGSAVYRWKVKPHLVIVASLSMVFR